MHAEIKSVQGRFERCFDVGNGSLTATIVADARYPTVDTLEAARCGVRWLGFHLSCRHRSGASVSEGKELDLED
jgi:hypothetical protein